MILHPYWNCCSPKRKRRNQTHKEIKRENREEREKNTHKKTTNKPASKLELTQQYAVAIPLAFPIFLKNNIHSTITTNTKFSKYRGLGRPICAVWCTKRPQNYSPYFQTSVKHLSLHNVGLQGSKVNHCRTTMYKIVT